jgi:Mn2+/Fe2+ NRAMP family transporter
VEEDRERGKATVAQRRGSTNLELRIAQKDVITGMLLSNLVMYFLILTTGATLHVHGVTQIETAKQAAEALDGNQHGKIILRPLNVRNEGRT